MIDLSGLKLIADGKTRVELPSSTFYNCTSLEEVTLSDEIQYIGGACFGYCSSLSKINMPNKLEYLGGGYTFRECTSLKSLVFPSTLRQIAGYAFRDCKATELTFLSTTPPTKGDRYIGAATKIYIPAGTLNAYQTATNWSAFADKFIELNADGTKPS